MEDHLVLNDFIVIFLSAVKCFTLKVKYTRPLLVLERGHVYMS